MHSIVERTHIPVDDYYRVMSIPRNASSEDIKRAYHRLVLQCHPDLHSMMPDAEARLRQVIEAHKILADPVSRAQYDRTPATSSPMWHSQARPEGLARTIVKRRVCAIKALIFTVVMAALIVHIGLIFNNTQPTPIDWEQRLEE